MRVFWMSIAFGAAIIATASIAGATMHLRMTDSFPKQNETIADSPAEVRVWFNQDVSLAVSRVGLEGPDGVVDMGDVEGTDDSKSFRAVVGEPLVPGPYKVTWRTAGDDGHVQRGEFSFTMATVDRF